MFGGFEGESYADIPTVSRTVGLGPLRDTCIARTQEMKEIADFARLLGCRRRRPAPGFHSARHAATRCTPRSSRSPASVCDHCHGNGQQSASGNRSGIGRRPVAVHSRRRTRQLVRQFRSRQHDPVRHGRADRGVQKAIGSYVRSVHCKDAKWAANPGPGVGPGSSAGRRRRRHGNLSAHARRAWATPAR